MFSEQFTALSPAGKAAYLSVFLALSVTANMFSFDITPSLKVTVTYTVCFFAALLMGAVPAFAVGFLGDALGFLLLPSGIYWLFGLTLGVYGFLLGCVLHCLPAKNIYLKAGIAFLCAYLAVTLGLNSVVNYYYVKIFIWNGVPQKTFLVYFAGRVGLQSAVYAINVGVSMLLLPVAMRLRLGRRRV